MRNFGKIRRLVFALAAMLVFTMVGGTWAYFTDSVVTRNEYRLNTFDGDGLVENFIAPTDWLPGQDVNKDVFVKNEGNLPIFAKVVMNQRWTARQSQQQAKAQAGLMNVSAQAGDSGKVSFSFANMGTKLPSGRPFPVKATSARAANVSVVNIGTKLPSGRPIPVKTTSARAANVSAAVGNATIPLTFDAGGSPEYAAQLRFGPDVVVLSSGRNPNASMNLPLNSVNSAAEAAGKWLLVDETPDSSGNITFYYIGALAGNGAVTPKLLDSVVLNPKLQAAITDNSTTYDKAAKEWVTIWKTNVKNADFTLYKMDEKGNKSYVLDESGRPKTYRSDANGTIEVRGLPTDTAYFLQEPAGNQSYEDAHFALDVRLTTVQGTEAALDDTFLASGTAERGVIETMGGYTKAGTAGTAGVSAYGGNSSTIYTLYFEQSGGKMVYTPVLNANEKWFMSDLNMLPGETYAHTLQIENRTTNKAFDLYMQAVPLTQDARLNELLEYIHMKVYNGNELVYDGRASGQSYANSKSNLRDAIKLGTYGANWSKALRAEVTADKNTPLEYSGLTTQIDWRFLAEETTQPTPSPIPTPTPLPTQAPTPTPSARAASVTPTATPAPTLRAANEPVPYGFVEAPDEPVPYGAAIAPASPKTGDESNSARYILVMAISGICLLGCIVFLIATRKKRNATPQYGPWGR